MTFKTQKSQVFLPAKWVYSGITEELRFGTSKAIANRKDGGEGLAFLGTKEDLAKEEVFGWAALPPPWFVLLFGGGLRKRAPFRAASLHFKSGFFSTRAKREGWGR